MQSRKLADTLRENARKIVMDFSDHAHPNDCKAVEVCLLEVANMLEEKNESCLHPADVAVIFSSLESRIRRGGDSDAETRKQMVRRFDELVSGLLIEDGPLAAGSFGGSAGGSAPVTADDKKEAKDKLRILLAEDAQATRNLLMLAFESSTYSIGEALNGKEAVESFRNFRYDLLLIDVQMPVMDGLSATREIRELENAQPFRNRTPIIAFTASVSDSVRSDCFKAGVDAFLPKPIDFTGLFSTIDILAENLRTPLQKGGGESTLLDPLADPDSYTRTFNRARALERLQGDHSLLRSLAEFFLDDYPGLLEQIWKGIRQRDAVLIRCGAHALKGIASGLSAERLLSCLEQLEHIARSGMLDPADRWGTLLEQELKTTVSTLQSYLEQGNESDRMPCRAAADRRLSSQT